VARQLGGDGGPPERGELVVAGSGSQRSAQVAPLGKQLYRVPEAMGLPSISRSVIYEQIRSGRLRSVTQGRMRLIPASAITEYIALLEREARAA
jgi:excisionase family DNA binding protein